MRNRSRLLITAVTALVFGVSACGGSSNSGSKSGGSDKGPIKIAVIGPLTGPLASQNQVEAAKTAAGVINADGGILGHKIELIEEDSAGSPTQGVQAVRKAASAGAHLVVGFTSSAVCKAVGAAAEQANVLYFGQCSDPSLLKVNNGPKTFYMSANVVTSDPLGATQIIKEKYSDIPTWDVYSLDYVTGHTVADSFSSDLKEAVPSASIGAQVFTPLNASDMRPYISSLLSKAKGSGDRGLYVYAYSTIGINFIKQAVLSGLFDHYKVFIWQGATKQGLDAVGAKTPQLRSVTEFMPAPFEDDAAYKKAAAESQKLFGHPPEWEFYAVYQAIDAIAAAAKKANSIEVPKIQAALEGLQFTSIKGPEEVYNRYFVQGSVSIECASDASASAGYKCTDAKALTPQQVTPKDLLPPDGAP